MIGVSYTIALRLSFVGIAEVNPFVRYWLAAVTSPTLFNTNTKKADKK